jgi:hypothetical protein
MSLRDWFLTPAPGPRRAPTEPGEDGEPAPPTRDRTAPAPGDVAAPGRITAHDDASLAHIAAPGHVTAHDNASLAHIAAPVHITPPGHIAAPSIASAAVIGRPGEAEPVAAGLALALRGRAPAAAVIVVGEQSVPNADGGTRAARRLAAGLGAHGFEVAARGRLAWAYVTPDAARRAAHVAGEPVVLAITAPLDPALELAIADQAVALVVARDERGPLAQLATASLASHNVSITKPLARGLPRLLARHGLRAPAELRIALGG